MKYQQQAQALDNTLRTEGWKYLDENLKNLREAKVNEFLKTRDDKSLRLVDGIDALYLEIHNIFEKAKIEKLQ